MINGYRFRWLWIAVGLWGFPAWGDTEIVPVRHRLPEELVRIVAPLLEAGEVVVPAPNTVVIKAPPERVGEIRHLLQRFDRPLRTLVITVLQSDRHTLEELDTEVRVEGRLPEGAIQTYGHLYHSESDRNRTRRQSLKVTEGQAAWIAAGEEIPVPVVGVGGFPPQVIGGIEYHPVTSGFRVVPRVVGRRIRLEIAPWSRRLGDGGDGSIEVTAAATTVEVEPGQWVELGGHGAVDERSSGRPGFNYATRRDQRRIFLRVELNQSGIAPRL